MQITGLTPLTLIDYPCKLACIVFTQGCNFYCPFCHNPDLIKIPFRHKIQEKMQFIYQQRERDLWSFLKKRVGKLEGVVITGGEPTLQTGLIDFLRKIKEFGFLVKLDTNGSNPEILAQLLEQKLFDYIAMDVKQIPEKYTMAMGRKIDLNKIRQSIFLIQNSGLEYEFRTTVVPGIHIEKDILKIANWLQGSKNYYLQEFRPEITLGKIEARKNLDLESLKLKIKGKFDFVGIRK